MGIPAQKAIVDRLMKSVGSFSSRQNINAYVTGKMGGTLKQDLVFSVDIVRDIVKELKPAAERSDDKPVFESEDNHLKHVPLVVLSKVAKQIRLGLQGRGALERPCDGRAGGGAWLLPCGDDGPSIL